MSGLGMLDDRDREVLEFLAGQRMALATHVKVLLGGERELADTRLTDLEDAGLVRRERVLRCEPDCFRITLAGLAAIGSDLPPPDFDPRYRHDVGVAWLWLAATRGAFGPPERVITERQMRSSDAERSVRTSESVASDNDSEHPEPTAPLFGIRLADGGRGPQAVRYPDLFVLRGSRRVAVHLLLVNPSPRELERLLAGYEADMHADTVLFLVADPRIGRLVGSALTRVGRRPAIHILPAALGDTTPYPVRPSK
jgi:hypothetical protein